MYGRLGPRQPLGRRRGPCCTLGPACWELPGVKGVSTPAGPAVCFHWSWKRSCQRVPHPTHRCWDVLPVRLLIPPWFYPLTAQSSHLSQLGPKDWLCPSSHPKADHMTQKAPDTVMCTIQLTAADGALCVINPLYLHEHGDDWLTHRSPGPQEPTRLATYRRERRLSTTRPWSGASISVKEAVSLEQESFGSSSDSPESSLVQSASCPPTPTGGVVLRRPSRDVAIDLLQSTGTQVHSNPPRPVSDPKPLHSPSPLSPHRVSWIEDNEWLSHPPPPSLLHPPSLELDSLSISSVEEELESANSPVHSPHTSHRLADKVKNRFSAVGQALGGLMSPQKRLTKRVQELSERKGGVFAEALRGFVEMFLGAAFIPGMTGVELLQEVRASLTALRETLLDCPEMHTVIDSLTDTPDWELDAMLELSLHKVALKPVCTHLYNCLRRCRNEDDSLRQLKDNQKVLEGRAVGELDGTPGTGVPDPVTLERIQQKWAAMHRAYSPSKKVRILLKVCKTIYHSMTANARTGVVFGADDFLPCLTWVLLRSDVITLQLDIDYMMELLEPTQLQGEGGYYLTSLYASLFYISSYRPRLATRQLSTEAQNSLRQWHRRRTLHCNQSRRSGNRKTIRRSGRGESSRENCNDAATETDVGSGKDPQPVPSSVVAMALHVISEAVVAVRDEESTSRLESRGSPTTQLQEGEDDAIRTVEQTASQKRGGLWEGGVREENVEEGPV
ncbi:ras and Rab interactor 3 isoform X2 [Esox lucius]|uniref:ras and Rab interactor 3 isoform X2 n=1 Tax=Esox lucius TaxID=8010 RepID=UPI00147742FF|nr:ras and Rab interactor 3 isoform X2 [Esox lucius]